VAAGLPGFSAIPAQRKAGVNGAFAAIRAFIEYFRLRPTMSCFEQAGIAAVDFESADPSVVKSIKQRDLLNTWLRLYARDQSLPRMDKYQPERMEDELPDLVFYTVDTSEQLPRLTIESDGTRMSSAYGHTGKGRYLGLFGRETRSARDAGLLRMHRPPSARLHHRQYR
jgi:hypothetical protein